MSFAVGDLVVVNGLPGTVVGTATVGPSTVYQVQLQQSQVRWLNATQAVGVSPIAAGSSVLVGAQPATVIRVWPGGPYPLYLCEVDALISSWFAEAQLNPPLPVPHPAPAAGPTAGRIPARV